MAGKYPDNCCPACGHPVGSKRYYWRAWIWARWQCESCGTRLRFDLRRRLKLGLRLLMFVVLMLGIATLCIFSRLSPWIWTIPLLVIYISGFIFIFFRCRDRIIAAEPGKDDSHALPNDA
jgi:hypothetical protein